jgi:hypothetical protein
MNTKRKRIIPTKIIKRRTNTKRKRTNTKRKRMKGGEKNINEVIGKLREIKKYMDSLSPDMPEVQVVAAIEEIFSELLHVKSVLPRYPTVVEHLANLTLLLELFDEKYSGKDALQDSSTYQETEHYPSGCLDAQLDWLTGFLIGPDQGITVHNKNARVSLVISRKMEHLKEYLKTSPSRTEYEYNCNIERALREITLDPDIMVAIKQGILHVNEIKDIFDAIAPDYFVDGLFNDGETPIPPIQATTEFTTFNSTPILLPGGSRLYGADDTFIGTVNFNNHFVSIGKFINITSAQGTNRMVQIVTGMKYSK